MEEIDVPFPYFEGMKLDILAYKPPPVPDRKTIRYMTNELPKDMDRLEYCLEHLPTPGEQVQGASFITLELGQSIRIGKRCASQLWHARIWGSGFADDLVAKIYDPVYAPADEDKNIVQVADYNFSAETAAYQYLETIQELQGLIPRFYGSYTCTLPTHGHGNREVRIILLEFISGGSLKDLGPATEICQEIRMSIMESIVLVESLFFANRIINHDLHPRNVILLNQTISNKHSPSGCIIAMLIDFEACDFIPDPFWPGKRSPIIRWAELPRRGSEFLNSGWIDWDWNQWLIKSFINSECFEPLSSDHMRRFVEPFLGKL